MSTDSVSSARKSRRDQRAVAIWLWSCVAALFAMIVLGGVVRLTGSGLSITVWEPIIGAIPPLTQADWERAFGLYRQSPEFRVINPTMDLAGFKTIFWFEYLHRLLGRSIGFLILVPGAVFAWRRLLRRKLVLGLVLLVALGGLQGLVGWYMVKSGLSAAPHVSHYRLTLHLGLGFLIFAYAVWLAIDETIGERGEDDRWPRLRRATLGLTAVVAITALSGGLVAGLKAGHAFPTFPLMAGELVPQGLFAVDPIWRNFVDSALTVQFQHRVLALVVFVATLLLFWASRRADLPRHARRAYEVLLGAVVVQVGLGIATLLLHVPVAAAAAHQGNAAIVLALSLYATAALRRLPASGRRTHTPDRDVAAGDPVSARADGASTRSAFLRS